MNYSKLRDILLNLDNSLPIYIAGHINPDQDSICSCLALAEFLTSQGKIAKVLIQNEDKDVISWKNNARFLTNKVNNNNYAFIALDLNEKSRLGIYESDFNNAKITFNIDHHENNKGEAKFTIADGEMSSTCEMIYNLINFNKNILTKDICEYLYSGMLNDTNCFSRRLTNKTLKIAQELINNGINYPYIIKKTFSNRSLELLKAQAEIVNNLHYENFYYAVINKNLPIFKNLSYNQIFKQIAEEIRKVDTIENLVFFVLDSVKIKGKIMTNTSDNANKIAELFGGGGHKREAGFTTDRPVEELINTIKCYIKEIMQ